MTGGDTPAPASAGLEARTRPFGDLLPLPNQNDSTVDGPPPPLPTAGSRTTSESNRVSSPDEPTAIMPRRAPPSTVPADGDTPVDPPTAAQQPNLPLLTAPFPGVLPTPRPREDDLPDEVGEGARVGGHVLGKRLAQRPTGDVFAGQHAQHGDCVVQVLSPGMAATYAGRGFLLDARARTTIDDPRLVRVLGVGDAPRPWVAMERLRGPTLRQTLDQEGALPLAEAARIARELARGLTRAHARRIVHGDLTPRDVRLEGEARAVKLSGFGVPKAIGPTGTRHAFAGGPSLGEAAYAAPELFQGERAGAPSDVWAIGAILHEMLAGRAPFVGSAREVMDAVLRGAPPTLEAARPDVPPALATVVRRCLARAPGDRYASAQELAAALHEAVPEPRAEVAPTRARASLVVIGLVAALVVVGGVVVVFLRG
jgi:serine/threonine-protein kinase